MITRPASEGHYILLTGTISAGYLQDKIELDKMLHLRLQSQDIRVTSGGEPVEAFVLVPRTQTNPLVINDPTTDPNDSAYGNLYTNPVLLSVPEGTTSMGKFTSAGGMTVQANQSLGNTGSLGMPAVQINFTIDADSSAWVTMPHTYRVQHTAIGMEDVAIGILIPRDTPGEDSFEVVILGESVATVRRR